jgi:hypothetical protein
MIDAVRSSNGYSTSGVVAIAAIAAIAIAPDDASNHPLTLCQRQRQNPGCPRPLPRHDVR